MKRHAFFYLGTLSVTVLLMLAATQNQSTPPTKKGGQQDAARTGPAASSREVGQTTPASGARPKGKQEDKSEGRVDHSKLAVNCKVCHECEYPTRQAPCLVPCPRGDMISVYHSPEEGPEVVIIDELKDKFSEVVFSHRIHAQMSGMAMGCTGCHHYNTTGPVLNCKKCHQNSRNREDRTVPDILAAFHRQCLTCHKQWSRSNGCYDQCHVSRDVAKTQKRDDIIASLRTKNHPEYPPPKKIVYQTNFPQGKYVTFFHESHSVKYKIVCATCHHEENCTKCHEKKGFNEFEKPVPVKRSFEEHHQPCGKCHSRNNCDKCHQAAETGPFNHASTGWPLNRYHEKLECQQCHGVATPYRRLNRNCANCHANFVKDKFKHQVTGLTLSPMHAGLDCESCHLNKDFSKKPSCAMCHNDRNYPQQLPGKRQRQ